MTMPAQNRRRLPWVAGLTFLALAAALYALIAYSAAPARAEEAGKPARKGPSLAQSFEEKVLKQFDALEAAVDSGNQEDIRRNLRELRTALRKHQEELEKIKAGKDMPDSVARFVDPPESVTGPNTILNVEIDKPVLESRDAWVAVRPVKAPDQIWLQGSRIFTPKARQNVYLGLKGVVNEDFEVLVVTVPKGTFKKDVAFKTSDIEQLKVEIAASHIIHRTE
jgi:hypothetical protein